MSTDTKLILSLVNRVAVRVRKKKEREGYTYVVLTTQAY